MNILELALKKSPTKLLNLKIELFSSRVIFETIRQWLILLSLITFMILVVISIITLMK